MNTTFLNVRNAIISVLGEESRLWEVCLYYQTLSGREWTRSEIETIEFESERTLKRTVALDVDYNAINQIRYDYNQTSKRFFLPLQERLIRRPLLNAEVWNSQSHHVTLAQSYENEILNAAVLTGRLIRALLTNSVQLDTNQLWVLDTIEWILESTAHVNQQEVAETAIAVKAKLVELLPDGVYDEALYKLGDKFFTPFIQSYQMLKVNYTLFAAMECSNNPLEARREFYSEVAGKDIDTITLVKYDSVGHSDSKSRPGWKLSNVFTGTEYMIGLPLFGRNAKECHARLVCPKGMIIDSVRIFCGTHNFPLYRWPLGSKSPKHWSPNYGYMEPMAHVDEGGKKKPTLKTTGSAATLNVIYNRRHVELHDCGLPPRWPIGSTDQSPTGADNASSTWQVCLSMSSRRSRFLVPTLGLLVCSIYALAVNILKAKESDHGISLSSVSTLGLPLLLGFLVVGEEHLVLYQTLLKVRSAVAKATVIFVITACSLAVVGRNQYSITLFVIAIFLGLKAIFHTLIQIVRIEYFRADAFEDTRMKLAQKYHELIDDQLAEIYKTENDRNRRIKLTKRLARQAKWKIFNMAVFNHKGNTHILHDVHAQILPTWALKLYPTTRRKLLLELLLLLLLIKATAITYSFVVRFLGVAGKTLWPIVEQALSWLSLI